MQAIINVTALTPYRLIRDALILVEDGKILEVCQSPGSADISKVETVIDGKGLFASPGFIDIHVHGGGGFDVTDGNADEIVKMCHAHALNGTTSILPTTLAAPYDVMYTAIDAVREAQCKCTCSNILGIHLEGPYFSQAQRGAQSPEHIRTPKREEYIPLLDHWDGIRLMAVAPELEGGLALGRELCKRGITASIGHSDANYDQVVLAIENGYTNVTHIYSGCSGVIRINAYRVAGVIEAGLLRDELSVQVIADGKHLPEALLRLIYKCKGPEQISLITDGLSFSASELREGIVYRQKNGMEVILDDGVMKLPDRQSFTGSVCTSNRLVHNMMTLGGASLPDAVKMATVTPASVIGLRNKATLAADHDADIILFDNDIDVKFVMVGGKVVRNDLL